MTNPKRETLMDLRKLHEEATPGPWTLCPDLRGCDCGHGTQSVDALGGEMLIAEFRDLTDPPDEAESNNTESLAGRRANAAFIAAFRSAAPFLLDVVDAARKAAQYQIGTLPWWAGMDVLKVALARLDAHLEGDADD